MQRSTYTIEAMVRALAGEPLFGSVDCALRLYDPHTQECLDFDELAAAIGGVPAAHHLTHEDGGADEINVEGLSGQLADPQIPAMTQLLETAYHWDTSDHSPQRGDMIYARTTPFGVRWGDLPGGVANALRVLHVSAGGLPEWVLVLAGLTSVSATDLFATSLVGTRLVRSGAGGELESLAAADAVGYLYNDGAGNLSWEPAGGVAEHLLWDPMIHVDECWNGGIPIMPEDGDILIYRGASPGCWTLEKQTSYFPGGWS